MQYGPSQLGPNVPTTGSLEDKNTLQSTESFTHKDFFLTLALQ